jgi:hypothetical protein
MDGFPTKTIGIAYAIRHLPITCPAIASVVKNLPDRNDKILEIFGNDFLHSNGRESRADWLCLRYDNIANPHHCSSPIIKLSKTYRKIDALIAIFAARIGSASPEVLSMAGMPRLCALWQAQIRTLIKSTHPKPASVIPSEPLREMVKPSVTPAKSTPAKSSAPTKNTLPIKTSPAPAHFPSIPTMESEWKQIKSTKRQNRH